ncbi:MAG: hypothetical protein H3C30_13485 [Candidatus Hydrogenedentes bacterium]|nr:hypothetical protein [Candidatus Hydrogenedentota bacterium]
MRAGECRPPGSEPAATPAGSNLTEAAKNRADHYPTTAPACHTPARAVGPPVDSENRKGAAETMADIEAFCLDHLAPFPTLASRVRQAVRQHPEPPHGVRRLLRASRNVLCPRGGRRGRRRGPENPEFWKRRPDEGMVLALLETHLCGLLRNAWVSPASPAAARVAGEMVLGYLEVGVQPRGLNVSAAWRAS